MSFPVPFTTLFTQLERLLLGAATGSPYIVFISTSGMLRSSDIIMYIYIYN